jgi:hypothetical protein
MSATIEVQFKNRIIDGAVISADDLSDQTAALDLIQFGLMETMIRFNEVQEFRNERRRKSDNLS